MIKHIATVFLFLFSLFTVHAYAAGLAPERVTKAFYAKYLSLENKDMKMEKSEALKYMTADMEERIRRSPLAEASSPGSEIAEGDPGYDYFTKSQDYGDDWATAITVSKVFQQGTVSVVKVTIGNDPSMQANLLVILVQTSGEWRISKIFHTSSFYE